MNVNNPSVSDPSVAGAPGGRRGGLVVGVVDELTRDIREKRLTVGQKLPSEAEIVGRFGVSRTVVREAISRLQAAGLVITRHGIGTFVAEASAASNFRINQESLATLSDVIGVLELRIGLETEAAGLAAQRRTEEHLRNMEQALAQFKQAIDLGSDAVSPDFDFHMEIARATGNRQFGNLMTYLGTMIIPRARVNSHGVSEPERKEYLQRVHAEHESILGAIARQDVEAARAAMRTHLSNSKERLRQRAVQQGRR